MKLRRVLAGLVVVGVSIAAAGCGADAADVEETSSQISTVGDRTEPKKMSSEELGDAWPTSDLAPTSAPGASIDFPKSPADDLRADAACDPGKNGPEGDALLTITSKGLPRTALIHIPGGYDPTRGSMVVLNFHGFTSTALQESVLSRMNGASDRRNFIVVYPQGIARSWNSGACCGQSWVDAIDDVQFVRDLLDTIERRWCVDKSRIYATGMSNGGFFSHHLGCELSDRIAAIAPVAGVSGFPASTCTPKRAVPVLQFHGTWDPLVPYEGGVPLIGLDLPLPVSFPSVAKTITEWKDRNDCTGSPRRLFSRGDTECVGWSTCRDDADVVLCTTQRGGHTAQAATHHQHVGLQLCHVVFREMRRAGARVVVDAARLLPRAGALAGPRVSPWMGWQGSRICCTSSAPSTRRTTMAVARRPISARGMS